MRGVLKSAAKRFLRRGLAARGHTYLPRRTFWLGILASLVVTVEERRSLQQWLAPADCGGGHFVWPSRGLSSALVATRLHRDEGIDWRRRGVQGLQNGVTRLVCETTRVPLKEVSLGAARINSLERGILHVFLLTNFLVLCVYGSCM